MVVAQSIDPNEEGWGKDVAQEIEKSGWHEFRHIHVNDSWLPRWIKEPAAEYSSLSLRFGYSDKLVDTDTRPIDEIHYMNEMALWDTLLQRGRQVLEGRLLLRAHSSEGPNSHEWNELDAALDASWGTVGVRRHVGEFIERTEATIGAAQPDWSEAQVQKEAVRLVEDTLFENPEVLFGSGQVAKLHAGTSALRGYN
jgi:hypothetical protein